MKFLSELLKHNRLWAKQQEFSSSQSNQLTPKYLWITSLDTQLPIDQLTGLHRDEYLVYQNIGNVIRQDDMNFQAVVQYTVETLNIEHIIVCGRYDCNAVAAVFSEKTFNSVVEFWLQHIKKISEQFAERLQKIENDQERLKLLCELNVIEQVAALCRSYPIHLAWRQRRSLSVHGWIYDTQQGLLNDLEVSFNGLNGLPEHLLRSSDPKDEESQLISA